MTNWKQKAQNRADEAASQINKIISADDLDIDINETTIEVTAAVKDDNGETWWAWAAITGITDE